MALTLRTLIAAPLLATSLFASADPQSLLMQIYPNGGKTLYCHTSFAPGSNIRADQVYAKNDLLEHYDCITVAMCANNAAFQRAYNDLHNTYPVQLQAMLDRSGAKFAELPDSVPTASKSCPYRTSFQTFDPPDYAKGNVARAMVYMSEQYDLPMRGSIATYIQWNRLDPPDQEEINRNQAIRKLQGTSNPYVENPQLMDKLDDRRHSSGGFHMNFPE